MQNAKSLLKRLWNEEDGVTIIEYSLIAALIAIVAIGALGSVGTKVSDKFDKIADSISNAGAAG